MNEAVEREIEQILRTQLIFGSTRTISLDATFAELGLDSLAIINLITSVETTFGVEVAEKALMSATPLTLRALAAFIKQEPHIASTAPPKAVDIQKLPPPSHRIELLESEFAGRGVARSATWAVLRASWTWLAGTFTPPAKYVLLERVLHTPPLQDIAVQPGVELRPYSSADRDGLAELWPPYLARVAGRKFDSWIAAGAIAVVAVDDRRIVGLSVVSGTGEPGEVVVRPGQRACWGIYLREASHARGRGIGFALLSYSLADSIARGFRKQFSIVKTSNAPMLIATTQLLGFRSIGRVTRMRLMGVTRWSWEIDGCAGRGFRLTV